MSLDDQDGGAVASDAAAVAPGAEAEEIHVHILKPEGIAFGARCCPDSTVEGAAIIVNISDSGILAEWNRRNPSASIRIGYKIISVNNVRRNFWPMMFELQGSGSHHIVVLPGQESDVRATRQSTKKRPMVASRQYVDGLPRSEAGALGSEECTICLEDLDPSTLVVQLPCSHTFHPECAARWLTTQKNNCPLCSSRVDPAGCPAASESTYSSTAPAAASSSDGATTDTPGDYEALTEEDDSSTASRDETCCYSCSCSRSLSSCEQARRTVSASWRHVRAIASTAVQNVARWRRGLHGLSMTQLSEARAVLVED